MTKQAMIRAADKVIMTTDYSKLGKKHSAMYATSQTLTLL